MPKTNEAFCDRCGAPVRENELIPLYEPDDGESLVCPSCFADEQALHDDID